ncbi:MAG TPA: oxygenase MpaB family protein, partial [Naasia sp.]
EEAVAGLRVGPTARALAVQLLRPTAVPGWVRAAMPLARLLSAGLLPDAVRAAYRVRWDGRTARRFDRTLAVLLPVYRALPTAVRTLPSRVILRRFRAAHRPTEPRH